MTAPSCTTGDKGNPQVSELQGGSSPAPLELRDGGSAHDWIKVPPPQERVLWEPSGSAPGDERLLEEQRVAAMGAFIKHL